LPWEKKTTEVEKRKQLSPLFSTNSNFSQGNQGLLSPLRLPFRHTGKWSNLSALTLPWFYVLNQMFCVNR
jgi:hypothetical protein